MKLFKKRKVTVLIRPTFWKYGLHRPNRSFSAVTYKGIGENPENPGPKTPRVFKGSPVSPGLRYSFSHQILCVLPILCQP